MGKKKRHHYLPEFYLEGFVDPRNRPFVWVYEKGDSKIRKASAKDIAVQKHYYSFITSEGHKDTETFENFFGLIEGHVAPVFQKLKRHESLDDEEKSWFAIFLSSIMIRVPNFRENIEKSAAEVIRRINVKIASDTEAFKSMINSFEKETGDKIGLPVEDLKKFILNGKYEIKVDPQFSLYMLTLINDFGLLFHKMGWTILTSDGYRFITSDNPLSYDDPTHDPRSPLGIGLLNKNVRLTFPVTKEFALFATWSKQGDGYLKASNKLVRAINQRTIQSALKFVFSSERSEGLNNLVQKQKGSSPRLKVTTGDPIMLIVR